MRLSKDQPHAYQFAISHAMHDANKMFGWQVKWHNDFDNKCPGVLCVGISGPFQQLIAILGMAINQAGQDTIDCHPGAVGDFTKFAMNYKKHNIPFWGDIICWPTLQPFPQHIMDSDPLEDDDS